MLTCDIVQGLGREKPDIVFITMNRERLKTLISKLERIMANKSDHIDLFSEEWGVGDLDINIGRNIGTNPEDEVFPAHYLKIHVVD